MICDPILVGIWRGLLHAAQHEKIALLFHYSEGHPIRDLIIQKIQATERTARGVQDILEGGSAANAVAGFDEMIRVLEAIVPKVGPNDVKNIYEERAGLMSLRDKFKCLDEILAPCDEEDDVPADLKHLN